MYVSFVDARAIHPLVSAHNITPSRLGPGANPFSFFCTAEELASLSALGIEILSRLKISLKEQGQQIGSISAIPC
jgi:hypothetical protein